jgi:hypothetical protein
MLHQNARATSDSNLKQSRSNRRSLIKRRFGASRPSLPPRIGSRSRRRLNLSPRRRSHWLVESPPSFLFEHGLFGKPVPSVPDHAPAEPNAETCHEMLKPGLQSRNRARCLPARPVRQRALLLAAMPRHRCGRAAQAAATTTERYDLFRVALFAADRKSTAGAAARSCQGSLERSCLIRNQLSLQHFDRA